MFSIPTGNWLPYRSHLRRGLGCSSRILIISSQCFLLKYERNPFHVWDEPGQPGKGQGHRFFARRNLILYTWGWCTVWLTRSRIQSITGSVSCIHWRCAIMDPMVISNPHYRHGIRCWILTWYKYPTPMNFSAMASSNIPAHNTSGWNVILCDLATLAASTYLLKSQTRTFITCCSQSNLHYPNIPLLA